MWSRQYKKNDSLYLDIAKNRTPLTSPLCNIIDEFLAPESNYSLDKEVEMDEFEQYCHSATTSLRSRPSVLQWWIENKTRYPQLSCWAFDLHSIPAMFAECEWVFFIGWSTFDQATKPVIR